MQLRASEPGAHIAPPPRQIDAWYEDPLSLIWRSCAQGLGWRVERSAEVYASWDGRGTLRISDQAGMDPDDSVAQLILHEICHALVEGPAGLALPDWGLENVDSRDLVREFACHRLQAALADTEAPVRASAAAALAMLGSAVALPAHTGARARSHGRPQRELRRQWHPRH